MEGQSSDCPSLFGEEAMAKQTESREARIARICKAINKGDWGGDDHNAVTWLGSEESVPITRWPSGCPGLDDALGGGYPKGRFIEFYGPEMGGKCLSSDTYTLGQHGLMTVAEVFERNGFIACCTSKNVEHSYPLVDESGNLEETTNFYWNGRKPVFEIITAHGLVLKATARHPVRIVSRGMVQWKHAEQISEGDNVLVQKGARISPPENGMDDDDGIFLGLLLSEGHTPINGQRIAFSNCDSFLLQEFKRICGDKFGISSFNEHEQNGTFDVRVDSKQFVDSVVERYGISLCLSGEKEVPLCIRTAPLSVQVSFLRFYFFGDGGVESGGYRSRVSMSSKSWKMLHQIQLMLLNLGAFGFLTSKVVDEETYWVLRYDGEEARRWQLAVPPSTGMTRKYLDHQQMAMSDLGIPDSSWIASSIQSDCADSDRTLDSILGDCARGVCNLTDGTIREITGSRKDWKFGPTAKSLLDYLETWISNGWDCDRVVSVTKREDVPTFDFTKPSHTFWSNGLVSHNTTAALHAIAEHQKAFPDEDIGFIDSEYAFDEEYARAIGVDTRFMIVHQPEHGVQALNVLDGLIKQGLGLLVVDSVAALTTKEELEGDIGDVQVAVQARMMSAALRRLNTESGRRRASVIWTNQIRSKIGVMYGNPETTPAGQALKHYTSVRVRFNRIANVKEGDVIVSSQTKAEVKKNKVAAPFKIAKFYITFGVGIDTVAAILDDAIAYKVVEKRGSWLSCDGEQLGQGRAAVLSMLRQDSERLEAIKKKLGDRKLEIETGKKTIDVEPDKKTSGKEIKRPKSRTPVVEDTDQDAIDSPEVEVSDA